MSDTSPTPDSTPKPVNRCPVCNALGGHLSGCTSIPSGSELQKQESAVLHTVRIRAVFFCALLAVCLSIVVASLTIGSESPDQVRERMEMTDLYAKTFNGMSLEDVQNKIQMMFRDLEYFDKAFHVEPKRGAKRGMSVTTDNATKQLREIVVTDADGRTITYQFTDRKVQSIERANFDHPLLGPP